MGERFGNSKMNSLLKDKRILLTGGAGFLGRYVYKKLQERGCSKIFVPRSREYNLTDRDAIIRVYEEFHPQIVIHLAAKVGGIGANMANPGSFFYDNLIMGIQLIEFGRIYNVEKFVVIGTVCGYPKYTEVPFKEDDLWNGYPEETNAPYGLAKKILLVQLQAYRKQYGFRGIYLLPTNLYGPGDNFDLSTSHVIPAVILKCMRAKKNKEKEIILWGTGKPTRDFLYVEDAAEGIVLATEKYDKPEPINLGSGKEVSIKKIVELITSLTEYEGKIIWDTTKPDGQPRRCLDITRAKKELGFSPKIPLEEGLKRTIRWAEENIEI